MDINNVLKKIDSQEWRQHPVLKNVECSELGLVKVDGKIRKPYLDEIRGRFMFVTGLNRRKYYLHRLVYECFNGVIQEGLVIDHINTYSWDNRITNLRAVTPADNTRNPLTLKHLKEAKTRDMGKPVLQRDKKTNEIVGYFESISEASRQIGISRTNIYKSKGEYKWEFAKYRYSCKWGKWWISGDL